MKTRHLFLGLLTCLACQAGYAKETNVNVNTLTSEFDQAADQDVLLLESGIYNSQLSFPAGKTITLKAAPGAEVTFSGTFRNSDAGKTDGGIVLDGLNIITNDNYFRFSTV